MEDTREQGKLECSVKNYRQAILTFTAAMWQYPKDPDFPKLKDAAERNWCALRPSRNLVDSKIWSARQRVTSELNLITRAYSRVESYRSKSNWVSAQPELKSQRLENWMVVIFAARARLSTAQMIVIYVDW